MQIPARGGGDQVTVHGEVHACDANVGASSEHACHLWPTERSWRRRSISMTICSAVRGLRLRGPPPQYLYHLHRQTASKNAATTGQRTPYFSRARSRNRTHFPTSMTSSCGKAWKFRRAAGPDSRLSSALGRMSFLLVAGLFMTASRGGAKSGRIEPRQPALRFRRSEKCHQILLFATPSTVTRLRFQIQNIAENSVIYSLILVSLLHQKAERI